jgi:hypothetical protein
VGAGSEAEVTMRVLFIGLVLLLGAWLCMVGLLSVYAPRLLSTALNPSRWHWHRLGGPRATGRPIEDIAADLRGALAEHDRILLTSSQWYVAHDLRVCERHLHDLVEEAAAELELPACPSGFGGWTTAHLGVRLEELTTAGLMLPKYRGLSSQQP